MAKVLIVTKDMAEFNLYYPVAEELRVKGHCVHVVAEGLSMQMWIDSGYEIAGGLPLAEDFDSRTKIRYDIDPEETIKRLNPDVVMVGLADPIHLGESFGLVANASGVRLGFVEDLWFSHRRTSARPNFVCTLDRYGCDQLAAFYNRNEQPAVSIHVTGSPALDRLASVKTDLYVADIIAETKPRQVILIGGQGECTTHMLAGVAEALEEEAGFLVIPKLHPKFMDNPNMAPMKDRWLSLIYSMEKNHRVLWTPVTLAPVNLLPLATHVVSVFSNLLMEAVVLGTVPVSWMTTDGRADMMKSMKGVGGSFPLVELGAAIEVSNSHVYLNRVIRTNDRLREEFVSKAKGRFPADFKSTHRVVEAILV